MVWISLLVLVPPALSLESALFAPVYQAPLLAPPILPEAFEDA